MMEYSLTNLGLEPNQFASAFGASSYVLKDTTGAETLVDEVMAATGRAGPTEFKTALGKGFASGGARLAFDSPPWEKGAGKSLGSLEARVFESLRESHWSPWFRRI